MPSRYLRLSAENGLAVFYKDGSHYDHIFVWKAANVPADYPSLAALLVDWNAATGTPRQRSVLFCQSFDLATVVAALSQSGVLASCWGKLVFWRDPVFGGGQAHSKFPDGSSTPVAIGNIGLILDAGSPPATLDNLVITATPSIHGSGEDLALQLAGGSWSVDRASGSDTLTVSLDTLEGFAAGSIGLALPWPSTVDESHPLQRAQIAFVAEPDTPPPHGGSVTCASWTAQLANKVVGTADSGKQCHVHLDPRDGVDAPLWKAGEFNSRLHFGDAEIHSSFTSPKGYGFQLKGPKTAAARLRFHYDRIKSDGSMTSTGQTGFHPEGSFAVSTSEPHHAIAAASDGLNISSQDLMGSDATSEFLDLGKAGVTHIEFVKGPAFLLNDVALKPKDRNILDDRNGSVITSHVKFSNTGTPATVDFHSQSSEAPLFGAPTDHLRRQRNRYGSTNDKLPIFPHAGHRSGDYDKLKRYETTHLAPYRRKMAPPPSLLHAVAAFDAPPPTFAVTPQGILAKVGPDGNFQQLYFGNPDSKAPKDDFCLSINNAVAQLYLDVQQALKASQLFMVLRNPSTDALKVIAPSVKLNARDFEFTIHDGAAADTSFKAAALLVKYFKGKSIEQLLGDPAVWACAHDLAPKGNSDLKEWSPFANGVPDHLKRLHDVWTDPNWQGVLVIDFPLDDEPALIKALRPGLAKKPKADKVELRAPYFGLNALQATAADLKADPKRPGSVFGMIRYDKNEIGTEPDKPTKDDVEPGAAHDPDRQYRFIVESLQIVFENSQIADFKAKLFIKFDHLFWDGLDGLDADGLYSLELDGYYERRGSEDVFSLVSPNKFVIKFPQPESYLKQLTITRAQLGVVSSDDDQLTAFIGIDGELQLSEKIANLPIFSVKLIRLSSFGFEYSFKKKGTTDFKFRFKPSGMSVDIDFDLSGLKGLLSFLPVKLKGMSIALGNVLDLNDLHFAPITFGGIGTKFHFGFLMELDFGSLGNLAGDLRGMKFPMLLGWGGGASKGLAFGIQFPSREGKGIDIGIQQFIRLQADELNLVPCYDGSHNLQTFAIQAVKARIVMLGHKWPDADTSFAFFVPINSGRKPSWAFDFEKDPWYVGGGYRLKLPTASAKDPKDIKGVVQNFHDTLNDFGGHQDICRLSSQNLTDASNDSWSIVGRYNGELKVQVAISDPTLYGIAIEIPALGELDVMYRRINSQLGIFSIEYCLPGPLRQFQIGVATVRLPVFRIEIHTDGGFLFDFGFPWNNDFSRSCQVEIAIFLGSGGFYYGITSAAAADLLQFTGGYGYSPPDSIKLNQLRTLRLGFAARVGIGRSFTIGILEAEASVTIFGGVEGAIAYRPGNDLFHPTLYAVKGYVGLMVDIRATVNFAIIRASAHILAYAEVGFEIRRVLAKNSLGEHRIVDLPIIIFAEIGLTVTVEVEIHIGCVDITIHLSFSATWRYEEALTQFKDQGPYDNVSGVTSFAALPPPATAFTWNSAYRYWSTTRDLTIFATVLPCMARASDVEQTGGPKTCAVGTLLLPVLAAEHGLGDLARFLLGWVLLPAGIGTDPAVIDAYHLTLGQVNGIVDQMRDPDTPFWNGFRAAVLDVTTNQFAAKLTELTSGSTESFATIPLWPGVTFKYAPVGGATARIEGSSAVVRADGTSMVATDAAFSDFCRHLIAGTIPEIQQLIRDDGYRLRPTGTPDPNPPAPQDPDKLLKWSEVWQKMFATLS